MKQILRVKSKALVMLSLLGLIPRKMCKNYRTTANPKPSGTFSEAQAISDQKLSGANRWRTI